MKFSDVALGLILIVFALAGMALASTFPRPTGSPFGPALFPVVIGTAMAGAGAMLVASGLRAGAARPFVTLEPWTRHAGPVLNAALVLGLPLLYVLAADRIGFIPLAALMLFALTWRLTGRIAPAIWSATLVPLAVHAFFVELLLVPLPWGLLAPIAW